MVTGDIQYIKDVQYEKDEEHQLLIPIVENILDENVDLLTTQEEAWLYRYLLYLTTQNTSLPGVIREESEKIICKIHEL